MPIWLNYSYKEFNDGALLLPSYVYLLDNVEDITTYDQEHILRHVKDGKLLDMFVDDAHKNAFENPLIRKIYHEAYPYQMQMKFAWEDIPNDDRRNKRIIWFFDQFFDIDYEKVLETYCQECNRDALAKTYLTHEKERYDDIYEAAWLFTDVVLSLLQEKWYTQEATAFQRFLHTNLTLTSLAWISWNTRYEWDKVYVEVGNNTYTTLFHELTHAINRFFRVQYYHENVVCYDNLTKTNEWLSNFVAYHLLDAFKTWDIDAIDHISLDPIFFSMYIDIYATVREHGSHERKHNFDVIYQQLQKFEWNLLTDEKAKFYYERFYKFFHYDQHMYFYPKELMYYLWYHETLDLFRKTQDKWDMLIQCLLSKVCL